jgi:hypothetical protein
MYDIPVKLEIKRGSLFMCDHPKDRRIVALVLAHDDEHNRIVHIALFVYDLKSDKSYSIGFVPIDYSSLLKSVVSHVEQDGSFVVNHDLYVKAHELWLDSHVDGLKTFFTRTIKEIVEIKEQQFGVHWGTHPPAFYPATQEYAKHQEKFTKFLDKKTGNGI